MRGCSAARQDRNSSFSGREKDALTTVPTIAPLTVALVTEYFYPDASGSTPTDMSELARFLTDRCDGVSVSVVTSTNLYRGTTDRRLSRHENWDGIDITRVRTPTSRRHRLSVRLALGALFASSALLSLVTRPRFDVVVVVTNPPAAVAAAWVYGKLRRVPYVYLVHDLYPDLAVALGAVRPSDVWTRAAFRMQEVWLRNAREVVPLGRCMAERIASIYGVPENRLAVIRSWFRPCDEPRDDRFFARLGLNGFTAVFAGNLSEYALLPLLLEAAVRLRDARPDIGLAFIGSGALADELRREVVRQGLNNVRVVDQLPRTVLHGVLQAAGAAIVSLDERMMGIGVPSKLYAALGAGRPILAVVPSRSEVARIIDETGTGVAVGTESAEAIAAALVSLADDTDEAARMGLRGRRVALEQFSLAASGEKFCELLKQATRQ